ncbi:SDR family oxidoreductase [Tistrella sp.]|nr:SDR family oxidoreductase [Tistrella sp.]
MRETTTRHPQAGDRDQTAPVVVITGGSSGIGRCTALLFARRGWRVGLIARSADGLADARDDILREGGEAVAAVADVSDARGLDAAASAIEDRYGRIDAWINNAGVGFYAPFEDVAEEEFRRVTEVDYMGVVNGTRTALARMRPRNQGVIVNIGSVVALRPMPLLAPYAAAKSAVAAFTQAVRTELIHDRSRIHLALVHPPATDTPFFAHAGARLAEGVPRPTPPVYPPETVAEAIWEAVTRRRRTAWVGRATRGLGLVNRLMPGLADRLTGRFGRAAQVTRNRRAVDRRDPAVFGPSRHSHGVHGGWAESAGTGRQMRMAALAAGGLVLGLWLAGRHRRSRPARA